MIDLGVLPGDVSSWATSINNRGAIVGVSCPSTPGVAGAQCHAVLWRDGIIDLGALVPASTFPAGLAHYSHATAINDRGQIVGDSCVAPGEEEADELCTSHAFLWERGRMFDLGMLPGELQSVGAAVSNRGEIAGASGIRPVVWRDGTIRAITLPKGETVGSAVGVNNRGQVVLRTFSNIDQVSRAFLWDDGRLARSGPFPGGDDTTVNGVNNRGQVVGGSTTTGGHSGSWRAFLWEGGAMIDLGAPRPGTTRSIANAINNQGQVVGASAGPSGTYAWLWERGAMTDLTSNLTAIPTAINDHGQVAGYHFVGEHIHTIVWTVPAAAPRD